MATTQGNSDLSSLNSSSLTRVYNWIIDRTIRNERIKKRLAKQKTASKRSPANKQLALTKRQARLAKQERQMWSEGGMFSRAIAGQAYYDSDESDSEASEASDLSSLSDTTVADDLGFAERLGRDFASGALRPLTQFFDEKVSDLAEATKASPRDTDALSHMCTQFALTAAQWALQRPKWSVIVLEIVKQVLVAIPAIKRDVMSSLHGIFTDLLNGAEHQESNPHMESEGDSPKISDESRRTVAAAFALGDLIAGKTPDVRGLLRSAAMFGRDLNGLRQGTAAAHDIVKWIVEFIQLRVIQQLKIRWLDGQKNSVVDFRKFVEDVEEVLSADISEVSHPKFIKKMKELIETRMKISQLFYENPNLLTKERKATVVAAQDRLLNLYRTNLVKFTDVYMALRQCPFVINLDGPPGVGKSSILPTLIQDIMSFELCGKLYDMDNLIYTRGNTSYWDGYGQQPAIIMDEPWQARTTTAIDSTALEFINLVSEVPMRLDMAALHEKGMYATPEVVGITSNCAYPDFNEIREKMAVWRRRNALIRVIKYDTPKFEDSLHPCAGYVWMNPLQITTLASDYAGDDVLSYEELVVSIGAAYRQWLATAAERSSTSHTREQRLKFTNITPERQNRLAQIMKKASSVPPKWDAVPATAPPAVVSTEVTPIQHYKSEGLLLPAVPSTRAYVHDYDPTFSLYTTNNVCCIPAYELPDEKPATQFTVCANSLFVRTEGVALDICKPYDKLDFTDQLYIDVMSDEEWPVPVLHYSAIDHTDRAEYIEALHNDDYVTIWDVNVAHRARFPAKRCYDWVKLPYTYGIPRGVKWTTDEHTGERRQYTSYAFWQSSTIDEPSDVTAIPMTEAPMVFDSWTTEGGSESWTDWITGVGDVTKSHLLELLTLVEPWARWLLAGLGVAVAGLALYNYCGKSKSQQIWQEDRREEFLESVVDPDLRAEISYQLEIQRKEQLEMERILGSNLDVKTKYDLLSEANHYNTDMKRPKLQRITRTPLQKAINQLQTEMAYVNASTKIEKIRKNIMHFTVQLTTDSSYSINGLAIGDNYVICNRHFQTCLERNNINRVKAVRANLPEQTIDIDMSKIRPVYGATDLVIFELPKSYPPAASILKHFVSDQHLGMLTTFNAERNYRRSDGGFGGEIVQASLVTEQRYTDRDTAEPYTMARGYMYKGSKVGACGSPLCVLTDAQMGVICGIHVAGDGLKGLSELITREMLELTVKLRPLPSDTLAELSPEEPQTEGSTQCPVRGNVEYVGYAPDGCRSFCQTDTAFLPSLVSGVFPVEHGPSVKSLADPRIGTEARNGESPLYKGINKYAEPAIPFAAKHLKRAVTLVTSQISPLAPLHGDRRALTDDEIIHGVGTDLPPMDLGTSPGVPFLNLAQPARQRGKHAYFVEREDSTPEIPKWKIDMEREVKGVRLGEFLVEQIEGKDRLLRAGSVPFYVATENLKDELVSLKKIDAAKTRTFECMPLDVLMLSRKYFGMWTMAMQQNCVDYPISVGVTTPGADWVRLYARLNKFPNIVAGDYRFWDGKLMAEAMLAAVEVINGWYSRHEEDVEGNNARMALVESWIHTYVAVGKNLVQTHQGLPSGVCVTAPLNSLCNWLYVICVLLEESERQNEEITDDEIRSNFEFAFYGDDHVISVSDEKKHLLSFRIMKACMDRHLIGYTDSLKTDNVDFDFQRLSEVTYLKRRFVPKSLADVRAPLELGSILKQMNWIRKRTGATPVGSLIEHYDSFCTELHQHGPIKYKEVVAHFNRAIRAVQDDAPETTAGLTEITQTYDFYEDRYIKSIGVN